jgi:hypothetical protein
MMCLYFLFSLVNITPRFSCGARSAFKLKSKDYLRKMAVMARAQRFPELIEELRFGRRRCIGVKDATRLPGRSGLMSGYDFQRHLCSGHSSASKTFETYGRNPGTCDVHQNHSVEKQWHLNT